MAKVLVIDDDSLTRKLLCHHVELSGHTTIQSSSGRRGWDVLNDNIDLQLVITDLAMPDLNGMELIKRIRSDPQFCKIPIIIVSGVITLSEISDIMKLGASRFLPKPIDPQMLKDYISRVVECE